MFNLNLKTDTDCELKTGAWSFNIPESLVQKRLAMPHRSPRSSGFWRVVHWTTIMGG